MEERLEEALSEIRFKAGEPQGERIIDLSRLDLSTEDLVTLMPKIIQAQPDSLDLAGNTIDALPDSIANLTSLKTLNISENNLEQLPYAIGGMQNLELLEVNSNNLTSLPAGISGLTNLKTLDASCNQIEEIPENLNSMENITYLNLSENNFSVFPEGVTTLPELTNLDLSNNHLSEVSESIGNLNALMKLDLSYNELRGLPESISSLPELREVNLSENQIEDLPRSIASSPNLENISLYDNPQFTEDVDLWLNSVMFGRVEFERAAEQVITLDHSAVLEKLYGEDADLQPKIDKLTSKDFRLGSDENNSQEKVSGKEVLESFIKDIPVTSEFNREVYSQVAKNLLDKVFDETVSNEESNTALAKIATSTGNCATPIKSLLTQELVGMSHEGKLGDAVPLTTLLEREALEEKV